MTNAPHPLFDCGLSVRWHVNGQAHLGSIVAFWGEPPEIATVEVADGSTTEVAIANLGPVQETS